MVRRRIDRPRRARPRGGRAATLRAIGVAEVVAQRAVTASATPAPRTWWRPWPGRGDGDLLAGRRPALRLDRRGLQPARLPDRAGRPGAEPVHRRRCWPQPARPSRPLDGQLARPGAARVWVPAVQSRAEAFAPGADLRGPPRPAGADRGRPTTCPRRSRRSSRTWPTRSSRSPRAAGRPAAVGLHGGATEPADLAGHSVALLNRGTPEQPGHPGRHAAHRADARVQRLAVRGLDRRRPAHDAGRQQLRLAALEPHLRVRAGRRRLATGAAPGSRRAGQDYNHGLLACETSAARRAAARHGQPGHRCAGRRPDLGAEAARQPAGPRRGPAPARRTGSSCGCATSPGRPGRPSASVALFTGVAAASLSGPCEEDDGPPVPVSDGAAVAEVPPAGTVTMVLTPAALPDDALRRDRPPPPASRGPLSQARRPRARPAGLRPVLAARQGPGPGREPAGGRAPVPRPDRAGLPGRRAAGRRRRGRRAAADRGLRPGACGRGGAAAAPGTALTGAIRAAALRPAAPRLRLLGHGRPGAARGRRPGGTS